MVFTDSVSPLLKFRDDLLRHNPDVKGRDPQAEDNTVYIFHLLRDLRLQV